MNKRALFVTCLCLAPATTAQLGMKFTNGGPVDQYIDVPYHATLLPDTGFTIEAWITYDGTTLGPGFRWPCIARQNVNPNAESFVFRVDAADIQLRSIKLAVRTTTGGFQQASYPFVTGEFAKWTHVAGTFDGDYIKLYINGVERGSYQFPTTTAMRNSGGVLRIGNGDLSAVGAENWNGEMDEVRLWPYARSAAEIASTMNQALSNMPGEVSTWNLDFGPNDTSGNNDGANVGSPVYQVNTLQLTAVVSTCIAYGTATASCSGKIPAIGVNGIANIGNSAFAINGIRAGRSGGAVFVLIGLARLSPPITVGTAQVFVDPTISLLVPGMVIYDRYSRLALGIPNNSVLPGVSIFAQMAFGQAGCAIQPYATDAIEIKFTR